MLGVVFSMVVVMAVSMSGSISCFFLLYLFVESVFSSGCVLGVFSCIMVHVGIWSDSGGSMVPAVIVVSVSVVSVVSMSESVWCCGSCLVGVMMVVCRLFSRRKK